MALGVEDEAEPTCDSAPPDPATLLRSEHDRPVTSPPGRRLRPGWILSGAIVLALMAADTIAHDPHRMLTQPLWVDENWVAVSLRAPVNQVLRLTASTPVLFTLLLRVVPHGSPQGLRLLALAFTVAAVVPAWFLGREIDRRDRLTAILVATGVALGSAMLIRHDLKQYTAEACDALLILWMLARLERQWSQRRLVALGVVMALSTLISNVAVLLGAAVLVVLAVVLLARRDGQRLRALIAVGAATLGFDLLVFLTVVRPADTPSLRAYWAALYIPTDQGFATLVHFVDFRAGAELQGMGMGPSLVVFALVLAGLVTLVRVGLPAVALVVPVVTVGQVAAAGLHLYPLWDPRTSTWFTVILTVMAMVGVSGIVRLAIFVVRKAPAHYQPVLAVAGTAAVATLLVALAVPMVKADRVAVDTTTPLEDVPAQIAAIRAGERPGDVVVANVDAGFGLGVYWPAQPELVAADTLANNFRVTYPSADRVVVAVATSTAAEVGAVRTAVRMAAATPRGRVWVVLSHWHVAERATIIATLLRYGTLTTPAGQNGTERVQLLTLRARSPGSASR